MAMLSKAKMMESQETPEDEAAESPEQQEQEASEGTEMHDTPETRAAADKVAGEETPSNADSDEASESGDSGLSDTQLQEYQRASQLLHTILYQNENTGRAVLAQIQPEDKVASVARAAVLIIQQIDKRLNLSDAIIPLMVITVVDRLLEMADRVKKTKYTPEESAAVVAATTNGVKALFGGQSGVAPEAGAAASVQGATPPQSQGGPAPAGPGLPPAPQAGEAPNPGGEE